MIRVALQSILFACVLLSGVGAGPELEVDVGQLGGLGAARVDDDEGAGGIGGDGLEHGPGAGHAVGVPRVLPHEERDLAVLEVAARDAAHRLLAHPGPTGLLLGEGIGAEVPSARRVAEA